MRDEPPQPGAAQGCSHPAVSLTQGKRQLPLQGREQRQRQAIPVLLCSSVLYSLRGHVVIPAAAAKAIPLPVLCNEGSDCSSLPSAHVPITTRTQRSPRLGSLETGDGQYKLLEG